MSGPSAFSIALHHWADKNKFRDGKSQSWSGGCAALCYRSQNETFGWSKPVAVWGPNAITIAHESARHMPGGKLNPDSSKAPIGATHFFDIGPDGHVETDLNGGGTALFGATAHTRIEWVSDGGINSVAEYCAATGATYLGWADNYGGGIRKLPAEVTPTEVGPVTVVTPPVAPPVVAPPVVTPPVTPPAVPPVVVPVPVQVTPAKHVLKPGEKLRTGDTLAAGPYTLEITADGELHIVSNSTVVWKRGGGVTNAFLQISRLGDLQLWGYKGRKLVRVWHTHTLAPGSTAELNVGGKLVVFTPEAARPLGRELMAEEASVKVTLTTIYNKLLDVEEKVGPLPDKVSDHEIRLRAIEKYMWIWIGASGVLGAGASQLISYIITAQTP